LCTHPYLKSLKGAQLLSLSTIYFAVPDPSTNVEAVRKAIDLPDESRKKVRERIKNMIV